jgi:hypothetical protein
VGSRPSPGQAEARTTGSEGSCKPWKTQIWRLFASPVARSRELHWAAACRVSLVPCICCFKQAVADLGLLIGCHPPGPQESGIADRESAGPLAVWSFTEPGRDGQQRLAAVGLPSNGGDERTRGCCPCLLGWANQRCRIAVVPHLKEPQSSLKHHNTHSAITAALVDPSHLRSLTFANYRCPDFGAARFVVDIL